MTLATNQSTAKSEADGSLALHIRRLRQWYQGRSLTQAELAQLAGISARHLSNLEQTTTLSSAMLTLLSIALALRVQLDALISPSLVQCLSTKIDKRRDELKLNAHEPGQSTTYALRH